MNSQLGRWGQRTIFWWVYVLPFPLTIGMYWVWLRAYGDVGFALYVSAIPILYGYIAPGIGTNLLHRWRFRGTGVVGGYYWHHGFMYAGNMSPLLFLAMGGPPLTPLTPEHWLRISLVTGILHGFVLSIHDVLLVKNGMVEIYNRPAREGRSAEEIVAYYAPLCFSLIGTCYAAGALLLYQNIATGVGAGGALTWVVASAPLFTIPGIAYFFLDRSR